jgi:hypothetical protein
MRGLYFSIMAVVATFYTAFREYRWIGLVVLFVAGLILALK